MTDRDLPRPAGDVVDDGVPATEEVRDEVLRTGDAGVADMPMPDRPIGADKWGITEFEERSGEPLDRRLARETPDDGHNRSRFNTDDGERFSEPGADTDYNDLEAASVGDSESGRYDTVSAEEAAMHTADDDDNL
jgi:hypothetical protein